MLPDYVAYLAVQRIEETVARNARPDAPVLPAAEGGAAGTQLTGLRTALAADLRRLANRLDPAPPRAVVAAAHRRQGACCA